VIVLRLKSVEEMCLSPTGTRTHVLRIITRINMQKDVWFFFIIFNSEKRACNSEWTKLVGELTGGKYERIEPGGWQI